MNKYKVVFYDAKGMGIGEEYFVGLRTAKRFVFSKGFVFCELYKPLQAHCYANMATNESAVITKVV